MLVESNKENPREDSLPKKNKSQLANRPKFKKGIARSQERRKCDFSNDGSHASIPFKLLMSNFRRKMIIDTLQDFNTTQEQKNEILNPYQEYLKKQSKLIEDKENQYYVECAHST